MRVTYAPKGINNFHNSPAIRLDISGERDGDYLLISARQARRVESHFCGIAECRCPHGAVVEIDPQGGVFGLRPEYVQGE